MKITKEQVLENIEEVKKYINEEENKKEKKVVGIAIKNRFTGGIIFQSTKTTYKEAIKEKGDADLYNADLRNADLYNADFSNADLSYTDLSNADFSNADLRNANFRNADFYNAKFYGKGGEQKLTKKQLPDFLNALGFQVID